MQNLSYFELSDPITRLNIMTQNKLPNQLKKFQVNNAAKHEKYTFTNFPLNLPRENSDKIYNRVLSMGTPNQETKRILIHEITASLMYDSYPGLKMVADDNFEDDWNGQFIPDLQAILITDNQDHLFIAKIGNDDDISSSGTSVDFDLYQATGIQEQNELILSLLAESKTVRFKPNLQAFNALKNFWLAQATQVNDELQVQTNDKHQQTEINDALKEIFEHVLADQDHVQNEIQNHLTYNDLLTFYQEVQNRVLTKATQNVQDWLFGDNQTTESINDLLAILKLHQNFKQISHSITKVNPDMNKEVQGLMKTLSKDPYFPKLDKNCAITFYDLHQQNKDYDKDAQHFMGIHGTNACSIPTIICDGLKSYEQLQKDDDAQAKITAQALGDGTYFARLDQASKALNYSSSDQRSYLIVADVAYLKPVNAHNYGDKSYRNQNFDFIQAPGVGNLHDYDEYVATNPQQQVTLKYLMEVTRKQY